MKDVTEVTEVTALIPAGKGRSEVWLDGEFGFVLYRAELSRLDIHSGCTIDNDTLERIYTDVLNPRALNRLLYLLGSRDMTEKELDEKLKKGKYPERVREYAISKLKEYGYVDDESYAIRYAECYRSRKSMGQIRQELLKRGISREQIARAFTGIEEAYPDCDSERQLIKSILLKRHYDAASADRKEKQKQYAYLCRKGFKSEDISAAMFDLT